MKNTFPNSEVQILVKKKTHYIYCLSSFLHIKKTCKNNNASKRRPKFCHKFYNLETCCRIEFFCFYEAGISIYLWEQENKELTDTESHKLCSNTQTHMTVCVKKSNTQTKNKEYIHTSFYSKLT